LIFISEEFKQLYIGFGGGGNNIGRKWLKLIDFLAETLGVIPIICVVHAALLL
jgi:hypothetical protein